MRKLGYPESASVLVPNELLFSGRRSPAAIIYELSPFEFSLILYIHLATPIEIRQVFLLKYCVLIVIFFHFAVANVYEKIINYLVLKSDVFFIITS